MKCHLQFSSVEAAARTVQSVRTTVHFIGSTVKLFGTSCRPSVCV